MLRILLILIFISVPSTSYCKNIAPNSSFEIQKKSFANNWNTRVLGSSSCQIDNQSSKSGKNSIRLENSKDDGMALSSIWTYVNVQPKELYRISFFYRTINVETGTRLTLFIYSVDAHGNKKRIGLKGNWVTSDDKWKEFKAGDCLIPDNIEKIRVDLLLQTTGQDATLLVDDVSIINIKRSVISSDSHLLGTNDQCALWATSGSRKVFKKEPSPSQTSLADKISIKAARNETEPFQVVITPKRNLSGLSWTWSDFSGPVIIPKEMLVGHKVEYIDIQIPSGPYGHIGLNPDPLPVSPMGSKFQLYGKQSQPFWFLVSIPHSVPPGLYKGKLTLHQDNDEWFNIPINLTVWNFTLPVIPTLDVRSQISPSQILKYESGKKLDVLTPYYKSIITHRSRPKRLYTSLQVRIQNEETQVTTKDFEKHLEFIKQHGRCDDFEILGLLFIRHKADQKWPSDASWKGIQIFSDEANTILNPIFEKHFKSATKLILDAAKRVHCYGSPSIKFFDEPNMAHVPTVNAIRTLCTLLKSIDKNIRVVTAARFPHPDLTNFIDEWDIQADYVSLVQNEINAAIKKGNKINVYHNTIPIVDLPALRTRLFPWMIWQSKIKGALCWWNLTNWKDNPWNTNKSTTGSLLYPPRTKKEHGPITSLRWEMLRQGLEDYEYLNILNSKLIKNKTSANFIYPELNTIVSGFPNVFPINDQPYTLDTQKLDLLRSDIAKKIVGSVPTISKMSSEK